MAFSGGPDSAALAAALRPLAAERGLALLLAHVDHLFDSGSGERAELARKLALRLALPFQLLEADVPRERHRGESPEAAARRLRYRSLERLLAELGATRILTAHQRDDQVETILLQIQRGVALERLTGIPAARGPIRRPLLEISRSELLAALAALDLSPIADPTNEDRRIPRNRIRHDLLPHLHAEDETVDAVLLALADRAARLREQLDSLFTRHLAATEKRAREEHGREWDQADSRTGIAANSQDNDEEAFIEGRDRSDEARRAAAARALAPLPEAGMDVEGMRDGRRNPSGTGLSPFPSMEAFSSFVSSTAFEPRRPDARAAVPVEFLTGLPEPLRAPALRWLLEHAGVVRSPSSASMNVFLSALREGNNSGMELPGAARRLVARRGRLEWVAGRGRESRPPPFSYTFSMPGEVELPELGLRVRIRRAPVAPWMTRGDRRRVGFEASADRATVRSREPGERMRPLGAPGSRKLKSILIDRGVPAEERDRIPLLFVDGELAWVPGVALGERFALRGGGDCWLAELEALPEATGRSAPSSSGARRAPGGVREDARKE